MKKELEKIIEMINIWNQISGYTYTYEIIGERLYIKNQVTVEAITKLYGMLQMIQNTIVFIISPKDEEYEPQLEVLAY